LTLIAAAGAGIRAHGAAGVIAAALRASPAFAAAGLRLSPGLVVLLAILSLVDLGLLALALVSLVQRPTAAVRFQRKWLWAVVIVLVSWIGPLLYLAVGRVDAPLPDDTGAGDVPAAERARRAVELLYGPPEAPR
jgi:hypothetical protein